MSNDQLAGAVIAVVRDGALIFSKGYGYEDVARRVPVDPAQTLFRAGSVSKLFTWTAVMQLVEQGKLDLDTDVNVYLRDVQIPRTYPQPITLRNIMTHTTGFEDGVVGYVIVASEQDLQPMGTWLNKHMPARVRPPTTDFTSGANASYSNYATTLAGYIVETVAGLPYDDYVEQRIFEPLGMTRSTFREPLPPALASRLSGGYVSENGKIERQGFEFIHSVAPAAGLSATATDMTRFMLAYLGGGAIGDARILKPETVQLTLTRAMSPDPALNGSALGFHETWINRQRVIGHDGDTLYFHSILSLLPEHSLGLFASVNTAGPRSQTPSALEKAFIQHYFPATLPAVKPLADANTRNERYAGTYRTLRRSYTTFEKALSGSSDIHVTPMPDGTLSMPNPESGDTERWVEVRNGVFRQTDEAVFVAFKDEQGGHTMHLVGPFPPIAAERIRWYESSSLHKAVAVFVLLLSGISVVSAVRQFRAGPVVLRWARVVLAVASALMIACMIGFTLALGRGIASIIFKVPESLYIAETLALLAIPATLSAAYFSVKIFRTRAWRLSARFQYALTTVAIVTFLLILYYWNLIDYRVG